MVLAQAVSWRYFNQNDGRVPPNDAPAACCLSIQLHLTRSWMRSRKGVLCRVATINVKLGAPKGLLAALYGKDQWTLSRGVQGPRAYESRLPDGVFTTYTDEGDHRYKQLSAVAFIRSSSTGGTVDDSLVVYHNPFAAYPLDSSILADFRQFIDDGDQMRWNPSPPPVE